MKKFAKIGKKIAEYEMQKTVEEEWKAETQEKGGKREGKEGVEEKVKVILSIIISKNVGRQDKI